MGAEEHRLGFRGWLKPWEIRHPLRSKKKKKKGGSLRESHNSTHLNGGHNRRSLKKKILSRKRPRDLRRNKRKQSWKLREERLSRRMERPTALSASQRLNKMQTESELGILQLRHPWWP